MIYYVCREAHTYSIYPYLESTGPGLLPTVRVLPYEKLIAIPDKPVGHYIFTDHDRVPPEWLEIAAKVAAAVQAAKPKARILNHPLRTLERYALLRTLFVRGINAFDAARLDEQRTLRFPVFLRRESEAGGPETGLLNNAEEYAKALEALTAARSRKGRIAVEFADVRSPDGNYRKYSAQRIGDRLFPQHMFAAKDWNVKQEHAVWDDAIREEELAYIDSFPHRDQVMEIFDIAHIEYGRIDYGVANGRVVAFEINTNPVLPRNRPDSERQARRERVLRPILEGFRELNTSLSF